MISFRSRFSGSVKAAWTYTARGTLWRLVPAGRLKLLGEERDLRKKEVAFFCLDSATGRPLWEARNFGERWWTGMEGVHEGVAVFHTFVTPELPEHRGITAVDLDSAVTLWSVPDLKFLSFRDGYVRALRKLPLGERVIDLDIRSGATVREVVADLARESPVAPGDSAGIRMPETVDPDDRRSGIDSMLRVAGGLSVVGPVERLEIGDLAIIGFHERLSGDEGMRQTVAVVDRTAGALLYSEQTATNLRAIVPDSFMVYGEMLVLLRERRTLVAVHLPGEQSIPS